MFDPPLVESADSALMSKLSDAGLKPSGKDQRRDVLQDSELTPRSDDGSISEEESGGWLGGLAADFRTLAVTFTGAVSSPTFRSIGGAADFVHRSALKVANEIAQLEFEEREKEYENFIPFPWEVSVEGESPYESSYYEEDEVLKAKVFALSKDHSTFLGPYHAKKSPSGPEDGGLIIMDEPRLHLIRSLLQSDENLAAAHAYLSGRSAVKENVFWTNYFHHCDRVRREHFEPDDDRQGSSLVVSTSSAEIRTETSGPANNMNFTRNTVDDDHRSTKEAGGANNSASTENFIKSDDGDKSQQSSQDSLVPADESLNDGSFDASGDEDSYICVNTNGIASPPCSLNSVGDLVLVNKMISPGK